MTKPAKATYTITLRAEPRPEVHADPNATRRLRAALKTLLRMFGLRCLAVVAVEPDDGTEGAMDG